MAGHFIINIWISSVVTHQLDIVQFDNYFLIYFEKPQCSFRCL